MRVQRRTNPLWGLLLLVLVLIAAAAAVGLIPPGMIDLILRAAPVLIIFAGLWLLLRDRVRVGGLIALVISAVLLGGVAVTAYSSRTAEQRDDTRQPIAQAVSETITLLRVDVAALGTDVELLRAINRAGGISGEFVGSRASTLVVDYIEAQDDTATLTIRETQAEGFPALDAVGRGTFRLELPPELPIDVQFTGGAGDVTLNMSGLSLERMNVSVSSGDVVVTLPTYDPLFSQPDDLLGELATAQGNLAIFIPRAVRARLELNRGGSGVEPTYDATVYNYLVGDILEARDIVGAEMVVRYALSVPRGGIRVEVPS